MGRTIYDGLSVIFGGSIMNATGEWITTLLNALASVFNRFSSMFFYQALVSIGLTLMVLYFAMDVLGAFQREMLSLDRMVILLAKYVAGAIVILALPSIMNAFVAAGTGMYHLAASTKSIPIAVTDAPAEGGEAAGDALLFDFSNEAAGFEPQTPTPEYTNVPAAGFDVPSFVTEEGEQAAFEENNYVSPGTETPVSEWPAYETVESQFEAYYDKNGLIHFFENIGLLFMCLILGIAGIVTRFAAYFLATASAIQCIVYGIMAPVAVVNCFEGETRSQGVRYLKKLAGNILVFTLVAIVLAGCSWLQGAIVSANMLTGTLTFSNIQQALSGDIIAEILLVQLAAIGGMRASGDIAQAVMGTKAT